MTSPPSNEPKKVPLRIRLPFATEAEFIARYGLHVARSTLFIATRSPKPVDTALTFELVLSDNSRLMRGEGVVQELRAEPQPGRQGMLVRLTRVDGRTKALIDRILSLRAEAAPRSEPLQLSPPVQHGLESAALEAPGAPTPTPSAPPSPGAPSEELGVLPPWLTAPEQAPRAAPSPPRSSPSAPRLANLSPVPAVTIQPLAADWVEAPPRPSNQPRTLKPVRDQEPVVERATVPVPPRKLPEPDLVLGIDLGDAQCRAAVFVNGRARLVTLPSEGGATVLPSVVAIDDAGTLVTGAAARAVAPERSVVGLERLLGRRVSKRPEGLPSVASSRLRADAEGDTAIELGDGPRAVAELVAELLRVLKAAAETMVGRPLSRAVVCAPLWYTAHQRSALLRAGSLAGVEVVTLLNDPSAAAMAFGFGRGLARKRVLVFDWAAGAFGAAVVEITGEDVEVVCAGGGDFLGVRDLERPAAEGGPEDEPLRHAVERAVEATRAMLLATGLQPASLDELLVTGTDRGAEAVRARLEQLIGRPPSAALDPHEAPAIGAAVFGYSLVQRSQGKRGLALFEVLGAPIGVAVAGGGFHKVLEQNTRLPAEKTLAVPARGHIELSVAVYQGTSAQAPDNEYLGVLTTTAERDGDLEVRFSVSADGRLSLSARSTGGQPVEARFDSSAADPEAVARHLAAATLGDPRATQPAPRGLFGGLKRFFGGH